MPMKSLIECLIECLIERLKRHTLKPALALLLLIALLTLSACGDVNTKMNQQKIKNLLDKQTQLLEEVKTLQTVRDSQRIQLERLEKLVAKLDGQLNGESPDFMDRPSIENWQKKQAANQSGKHLEQSQKLSDMDKRLGELRQQQDQLIKKTEKNANQTGDEEKQLSQLVDAIFKNVQRLESRLKKLEK